MEDRITRIKKMEAALDASEAAIRNLSDALDEYEAVTEQFHELEEYYGSEDWRSDFEADEAGLLPLDLKRGVLSEDGIYDLITEHNELMQRLKKIEQ